MAKTLPDMFLRTSRANESNSTQATSVAISLRGQHLLKHVSASPRRWGGALLSKIQARINRRPKLEHVVR